MQELANGLRARYWWILLLATGLLVAILALVMSIGQPIWFDEGYSILLARQPIGELLSLTAVDAHPPLYYLLLKAWAVMFGFSELSLRSLSALLMGLSAVVTLMLVRRLFGTRVALLVVPIIIFAPFALRYGYEVRMYALASLIGATATYVLVRAQISKLKAWWWAYAFLVALGMYTLYMTVVVWLAHFAWLAWVYIKDKKAEPVRRWPWLHAFAIAVLLFLPYISTFLHQMMNSALPGMGSEVTLTKAIDMITMVLVYTPEWGVGGWLSLLLAGVMATMALIATRVAKSLPKKQKTSLMLMVSLVVVPVLFFAATSLPPREPMYIVRYIAHIAILFYALLGAILGLYWVRLKPKLHQMVVIYGAIIALLILGTTNLFNTGNFNFERMQRPQTHLLRKTIQCGGDTLIVADDPYTYIDSTFYYDDCDLRFFAQDNIARAGGYAILHNSNKRIAHPSEVKQAKVVHLHWTGSGALFAPDSRYRLTDTVVMDKQVVDTYELIANNNTASERP